MKGIIPKKIKIGGHWFPIIFPYRFTERSDRIAELHFQHKRIRICNIDENGNIYPIETNIVNLIHEVLHGMNFTLDESVFDGSPDGERRTCAFAELMYQILVDNGWLETENSEQK